MIKKIFLSISICLSFCCSCNQPQKERNNDDKLAELTLNISNCSRLYTTECQLRKIVAFNDKGALCLNNTEIISKPGERKIAIPIDVTVKAYVDFSGFKVDQIVRDSANNSISVLLPDPHIEITSSKVDYAGTREYVSAFRNRFSEEEKSEFTKQGIADAKKQMPEMKIIEHARISASQQLLPMFQMMGFNNIQFTFREGISDELINSESMKNLIKTATIQ
ncbi:MAG: DUF4230 domain-containing protein [Paludibacteraceae bacterium]|nr:DUF4230 domain-containing protein [Paludibacteraceae bacterium]